jgi:ADP-ribosylglycohydrolase
MDESILKQKIANSFLAGMFGSAMSNPNYLIDDGMRYQYLILQALWSFKKLPDSRTLSNFVLSHLASVGLSSFFFTDIVQELEQGMIFPVNRPWDTPFGWLFACKPTSLQSSGRLAAAAVAEALQPRSTLGSVIEAGLQACKRHGIEGAILHERLEAVIELARKSRTGQDFKVKFDEKFQIPIPDSLLETIPLAFACLVLGDGRPCSSIEIAIEMGRNPTETARLVGQIAGAHNESLDLPKDELGKIMECNPEIEVGKISAFLGDLAFEEYRNAKDINETIISSHNQKVTTVVRGEKESLLHDKILGFLLGGACGDAMGCPVEWEHYEDIQKQWGWVDDFLNFDAQEHRPHPFYEGPTLFGPISHYDTTRINALGAWNLSKGTYSDDMRFRLLLCAAMLEKGTAISGAEFAEYLIRYRVQDSCGVQKGIPSWQGPQKEWAAQLTSPIMLGALCGKKQPVGFCLTWDGPVGLAFLADEDLAASYGFVMATCVAHAFRRNASLDSLVECAIVHSALYGSLAEELGNRIQASVEMARKSSSIYQFYRKFYNSFLIPQPSWDIFILEQIPATFALLVLGKDDPKQAILSAVNFGRDTDTIACMVGELAGALYGASALPQNWRDTILAGNPNPGLPEMASLLEDLALKQVQNNPLPD